MAAAVASRALAHRIHQEHLTVVSPAWMVCDLSGGLLLLFLLASPINTFILLWQQNMFKHVTHANEDIFFHLFCCADVNVTTPGGIMDMFSPSFVEASPGNMATPSPATLKGITGIKPISVNSPSILPWAVGGTEADFPAAAAGE